MKNLISFFTGVRTQGQPVPLKPKFNTVVPTERPGFNDWVAEFKVGRQYGLDVSWRNDVRQNLPRIFNSHN